MDCESQENSANSSHDGRSNLDHTLQNKTKENTNADREKERKDSV
jgi:hypothetical protein